MYFIKKIVSPFCFPLALSLEILFAGLILLWFTRRQKAGKVLITVGAFFLLALSSNSLSSALLHPLERRYPALQGSTFAGAPGANITYIVVLGGSGNEDPNLPITSHISPDLMVRLIEGIRLYRELPGSKLILSGGKESAGGMTRIARMLGVPAEDLMQLSDPRDTEEESRQIAPIVGSQRLILVTSASHMPRAMGFFHKRGLRPIPAPTDYMAPEQPWEPDDLLPDASSLYKSQVAFYEYLGLTWETLRGGI